MDWKERLEKGEDPKVIWGEIQKIKHEMNPEAVFKHVEKDIISKLYPEAEIRKYVSGWLKERYQRIKKAKNEKMEKYMALRKSGVPYSDAKRLVDLRGGFKVYDELIDKWSKPFQVVVNITSQDADGIWLQGWEYFKLNDTLFYKVIETKK